MCSELFPWRQLRSSGASRHLAPSHGRRCYPMGLVSRKFIRLLISPPLHLQHGEKEEVVMRPSQARKERTLHSSFIPLSPFLSPLPSLPSYNANPKECWPSIFLAAETIIMRDRGCFTRCCTLSRAASTITA